MSEKELFNAIEEDLQLQKKIKGRHDLPALGKKWSDRVATEPAHFISGDFTLRRNALRNFRGSNIFIPDYPYRKNNFLNVRNILDGGRRGQKKVLRSSLRVVAERGFGPFLEKYPCSAVGNPNTAYHKGSRYTYRWNRHIYLLGLFKQTLEARLGADFTCMDIGSSYGVFSSLVKKECPKSRHVLVDFFEQLVLAHYFLGMEFPGARIATLKDIYNLNSIDAEFIKKHDFILVPVEYYKKVAPQTVDLVSNFFSFGEMSKEAFDYYQKSEPFLSARYFFTVNGFYSQPVYDNNISILDYSLNDFEKLHFDISPLVRERYKRVLIFFCKFWPHTSQCFEFIGARKKAARPGGVG